MRHIITRISIIRANKIFANYTKQVDHSKSKFHELNSNIVQLHPSSKA